MSKTDLVLGIEQDFVKVFESLSIQELRHNRSLRSKTKKVADFLAKIAEVRRDLANQPKAPVQHKKVGCRRD